MHITSAEHTDASSSFTLLGRKPSNRIISLLWAAPSLTFAIFPAFIAYQHHDAFMSAGLGILTLLFILTYLLLWILNPTPATSPKLTYRFVISHTALLLTSIALVAWAFAVGNDGTMLNMLAYSVAAWIMQAPKRLVAPGAFIGIALYAIFQCIYAPGAGFPFGLFMASVMTALSRTSLDSGIHQEARQQQLLAIAHEQERLRIGADMHDILGHSLTAIVMKAQVADRLLGTGRFEEAHTQIIDLLDLSRSSLTEVRAVVANMRSLNLDDELTHATALLESAGISVVLEKHGAPPPGPSTTAFARILREATTNILAHSRARNVHICLSDTVLSIRNDGYSKSLAIKTRGSATGLQGLRDAIAGLGNLSWMTEGNEWILSAELYSVALSSPALSTVFSARDEDFRP